MQNPGVQFPATGIQVVVAQGNRGVQQSGIPVAMDNLGFGNHCNNYIRIILTLMKTQYNI